MVGKIRKFKWRLPIFSIIGIIVMSLMLLVNDIEAHAGSLYTYSYSGTGFSFATGTSPSGGSGDCFCFTPSKTGVYRIYSSKTAGDPYVILSRDYTTTKNAINNAGKYSYTGAYAGNDDGNGSLNFNIYAYMQKGTTYYIFATRWGSSTANFTTYCNYVGAGTITLNKQSGSGGTNYLYGGRSGYSSVAYPSETYLNYCTDSECTNLVSAITKPTRTGYKFG